MISGTFRSTGPTHQTQRKVPEMTALLWILKILITGVGEATADF